MAKKKKSTRAKKPKDWLPESAGGAVDVGGDGIGESGVQDQPFIGPTWANDRRIRNCESARELYVRLYLENQLRAQSFAQVRNQIEGGRPFDPDSLHASGEEWRTNVNFNDARAAFRRVSMPYWKMVHEVPQTISVKIHLNNTPDAGTWETILAANFDRFLKDWGPGYIENFSGMCDDYVMYGPAHLMWEDEDTPRYRWMPSIQVMLPKRTKSNMDTWELFCYKGELTAAELLKHIRGGKTPKDGEQIAKDSGWNPEMIHQAIRMAAPGPAQTRYFDPNFWQDMIVSNDLVIGGVWPPVAVVHMWARSPDGKKITHYIFTEKSDVPDYLFEMEESEGQFKRIMGTIFSTFGSNGLYHSIKGFGVMNYYYATAINRTKCRMIDSATFAMGMNFMREDDTPSEVPPIENYSMVNLFPKGLQQMQWYPQGLTAASELVGILSQNQDENNFTYNEPQKDIADTKTAKQAVILSNIASEMSTASSAIFLSQLGTNVFAEMWRRLVRKSSDPDAINYKRRCVVDGIPQRFFEMMENFGDPVTKENASEVVEVTIEAGASPTMASPAMREQISNWLMQAIMPQPDADTRAIKEFAIASRTGAAGINRFLLPVGTASDPLARRQAIQENDDMSRGIILGDPPGFGVDPSDSHVEHSDEHLKPLEAIVQQIQKPQPPQQAPGAPPPQPGQQQPPGQSPITPGHLMALHLTLPHIAQHLAYLQNNPIYKPQFQSLKARFQAVSVVAAGLLKRLAAAQQQAQASGQPLQPQDVQSAISAGGQ